MSKASEKRQHLSQAQYLAEYDITRYDRPSVAADIAAFTVQTGENDSYKKDPEKRLSVLLVKRGVHPYKGQWALPGGFIRKNETIGQCAVRELSEETGLEPVSLFPVGVFSRPDRDPRGRIISHAFASVISENSAEIKGGDDAAEAEWFHVTLTDEPDGSCMLTLKGDAELSARLTRSNEKFGRTLFAVIENDGLAFDHAELIATAIMALRREAKSLHFALDFLPEKFTLATLQTVQETLMGITYLTPNFRRKISEFVEETEEFTEGAGHRPARLFRRKRWRIKEDIT